MIPHPRSQVLREPTRPAAHLQHDAARLRIQVFREVVLEIAVEIEVLGSSLVRGIEHLTKGIRRVASAQSRLLTPQIFDHDDFP